MSFHREVIFEQDFGAPKPAVDRSKVWGIHGEVKIAASLVKMSLTGPLHKQQSRRLEKSSLWPRAARPDPASPKANPKATKKPKTRKGQRSKNLTIEHRRTNLNGKPVMKIHVFANYWKTKHQSTKNLNKKNLEIFTGHAISKNKKARKTASQHGKKRGRIN